MYNENRKEKFNRKRKREYNIADFIENVKKVYSGFGFFSVWFFGPKR